VIGRGRETVLRHTGENRNAYELLRCLILGCHRLKWTV
jgi:hypothetical protein